ncbi:unnamed protein product [Diamesa tonsa]
MYGNHRPASTLYDEKKTNEQKSIHAINKINKFKKIAYFKEGVVDFYQKLVGFNEMEIFHNGIIQTQEELQKIQFKRVNLSVELLNVRSVLNDLQTQLLDCKRGQPRFLTLVKKECDVIQNENHLSDLYKLTDTKERELFSHLQAKINVLHEKSRSHTRQWSIISSIIGALLGILGTSISAYFRNSDIRTIHNDLHKSQNHFREQLENITQKVDNGFENISKVAPKQNTESWASWSKRLTVGAWKWCFRQKQ